MERMRGLAEAKLASFQENVLGTEVQVFGNIEQLDVRVFASTARTRLASSHQFGHAFFSWTVRTNAQARVAAGTPGLTAQTFEVQQRRQDVWVQPQPGQPGLHLIQEREALPAEQQPTGLGPRRAAEVRQRRRDDRLGLGRSFTRPSGVKTRTPTWLASRPSRRPRPDPRAARPGARAGSKVRHDPGTIVPDGHADRIPSGPRRPLQGAGGRARGLPQRTPPFTERMEDVERVVEVGEAGGARRPRSSFIPLPSPEPSSRTTASSAGNRANSSAQVAPSRASTSRPVSQQRLSGSTTIRTGRRPKKSRRRCPA